MTGKPPAESDLVYKKFQGVTLTGVARHQIGKVVPVLLDRSSLNGNYVFFFC